MASQEFNCRKYSEERGYEVEAVFPDEITGSGDFMNRPGMRAVLAYMDSRPNTKYVLIFDDLKRFARDTEFHLALRRTFKARGATIESPNYKFEDTPEGRFIETVFAAQGELEREQSARQVNQKMRARFMRGYWVFRPAAGYRYADTKEHGKFLVRNEPLASVVIEAFEGLASGRFSTIGQIKSFFESHPAFPRGRDGEVHTSRVREMMSNRLYTGYLDAPKWDLAMVKGLHEPLVSFETWHAAQERLDGKKIGSERKDIRADFPVRGFLLCACCDKKMTAAWSKGRSAYYGYYSCFTKACPEYRRSVRVEDIDRRFKELMNGVRPSAGLLSAAVEMIRDIWESRQSGMAQQAMAARATIQAVERKIENLVGRIAEAEGPGLISAYEKQIGKLEQERLLLTGKIKGRGGLEKTFDQVLRTALIFLANPWKIYSSSALEDKRLAMRLVLGGRI